MPSAAPAHRYMKGILQAPPELAVLSPRPPPLPPPSPSLPPIEAHSSTCDVRSSRRRTAMGLTTNSSFMGPSSTRLRCCSSASSPCYVHEKGS